LSKDRFEIRVDHARVQVSELQLKAIQMKAEADGITIEEFCKKLVRETRQYYRAKMYLTKFGPDKAFQDEKGKLWIESLEDHSQRYTLKRVLEMNLYAHIRPYMMGLAMSKMAKDRTRWKPEVIILRGDNKVAVVKEGKLKLHSSDDWFKKNLKKKSRRES
jgi:hypothetical protein